MQTRRVLIGMQADGQRQAQQAEFTEQQIQWRQQAASLFDVKDQKLLEQARTIYQSDAYLQRSPSGEFDAIARASALRNQDGLQQAEAARAELRKRDQTESIARQAVNTSPQETLKDELVEALRTPPGGREDRTKILGRIFADNQLWTRAEK